MSIPCVQSSDVLNISGFGQILPWLLERKGTPLWYLLAYAEHSSFVGAEPTELLSLVHPRQPSCGNEREWSSLGGQLGLSYAALCAWKDTKPELLAFVLNCSAGEHQSCQCTPAPQEDAPAPLASAQGSTCFPQTHLHDINSSENCTCTYPLLGRGSLLSFDLGLGIDATWVWLRPCQAASVLQWKRVCGMHAPLWAWWLSLKEHSPAWLNLSLCNIPNWSLHAAGWST